MIRLIVPDESYKEDILKFLEEIEMMDNGLVWQYSGMGGLEKSNSYEEWLKEVHDISKGINLPEGYVCASTFIAINEDNRIVGMVNIRHSLNDFLLNYGGHVGYSVRPSERGKGIGTIILELALEECKKLSIKKVLVTCNEENVGSEKVIKNCGGIYENTKVLGKEKTKRYFIEVKED